MDPEQQTVPEIPVPKRPDPDKPIDNQYLRTGGKEQEQLASPHAELDQNYQRLRKFVLKPGLFIFVLSMNGWWAWQVISVVKRTGDTKSGFHLSDSVLIALITTSIANFLLLVHIVAKNLFPSPAKKS